MGKNIQRDCFKAMKQLNLLTVRRCLTASGMTLFAYYYPVIGLPILASFLSLTVWADSKRVQKNVRRRKEILELASQLHNNCTSENVYAIQIALLEGVLTSEENLQVIQYMNSALRDIVSVNSAPKVCQGCKFYHGGSIACAVHPSGVEGEICLDWETFVG